MRRPLWVWSCALAACGPATDVAGLGDTGPVGSSGPSETADETGATVLDPVSWAGLSCLPAMESAVAACDATPTCDTVVFRAVGVPVVGGAPSPCFTRDAGGAWVACGYALLEREGVWPTDLPARLAGAFGVDDLGHYTLGPEAVACGRLTPFDDAIGDALGSVDHDHPAMFDETGLQFVAAGMRFAACATGAPPAWGASDAEGAVFLPIDPARPECGEALDRVPWTVVQEGATTFARVDGLSMTRIAMGAFESLAR